MEVFWKLIFKPENNMGRDCTDRCIRECVRLVRDRIYCQDVSVSIEMWRSINYLSDCKLPNCEIVVLISFGAQYNRITHRAEIRICAIISAVSTLLYSVARTIIV